MKTKKVMFMMLLMAGLMLPVGGVLGQSEKKVLTLEDYGQWQRISGTSISDDGVWVTYQYRPLEGDGTLFIKNLETDKLFEILSGSGAVFSKDGAWAAYRVSKPSEEPEEGQEENEIESGVILLHLQSGETYSFENATSFQFAPQTDYLALRKPQADREAEHAGSDLILHNLETHLDLNIGNVGSFAFNQRGELLAYTIDAENKAGNGVFIMVLETGQLKPLDTDEAEYAQMRWDDEGQEESLKNSLKGTALAVLKGNEKEGFTQKENVLLVFANLGRSRHTKIAFNPAEDEDFPEGMVVSELTGLSWSDNNERVFFGIKEQEEAPKKINDPVANVDVWHWKDERIQSVQMRRASRDRNYTDRAVFNLDSREFVRLTDEKMSSITLTRDGKWGIGRNDKPYVSDTNWGGGRADYYRVDISTGQREMFVEAMGRSMGLSPDDRNYLFMKDKEIRVYNLDSGETVNISEAAEVSFVNEDDDHPYEKPAFGLAGWTEDGEAVIVNHRFDLWRLELDGSNATNITREVGDDEMIRFRYVSLDREARYIDTDSELLLSAYGEKTKKTGYFRLRAGRRPEEIIYIDKSIGRLTKARNADKILYTMQTFIDFPDYYVSDTEFEFPVKITDANPQQSEFAWSPGRILIDYENSDGVKLQGTLALPAGYEEDEQYPMIVYFYEKMSQNHHSYSQPAFDDRPHACTYTSNGYLFFQPDVIYTPPPGTPGTNAVDCVTAAVQKVIDLGYADPDRIGLQGHSWGGYQSSYILTQSDMFACVVTGAPVTDMFSMYNILYKSSGSNNHGIFETGQVRMGLDVTPMTHFDLYRSQSPVHLAANIVTPFLILHGTEDGAVDWNQGLEYFNAARRMGKEVILLSYPGEGHHLGKKENQKDFQIRMKQFFDHYLMDAEAPDWLENGIPFIKKEFEVQRTIR